MKTLRYYIPVLWGALMLLAACSDKGTDEPEKPATPSIMLDTASAPVVASEGGTATVGFEASVDWVASSDQPSWCAVSPASGKAGKATVTLTLAANTEPYERNATLTLQAGTAQRKITVTQKQQDALTVTAAKVEVPAVGREIEVEVKANVAFEYEIEASAAGWISPVTAGNTRALTTSKLKFNVAPNEEEGNRQGRIVFSDGKLTETVTVYQEGGDRLLLSQKEYTVASAGGTVVIELRSNVDYEMVLPGVDWLAEADTRSLSSYTHRLAVLPNEAYDSRTAEVQFVNKEKGIREAVKIVQVQKDAIIVAKDTYELSRKGGNLDFELNTNLSSFEVTVSEAWIKQVQTRGLTAYPLSFVLEENPDEASRSAVITVAGGEAKQQIRVTQAGTGSLDRITILHTNATFCVPVFKGVGINGIIRWGDGATEEYAEGGKHTYTSTPPYTVVLEMEGAEEVTLPELAGIEEVDLSKF